MTSAVAKLSVSVPLKLAARARKRVGARGLSGFVARAMQHELEREDLGTFLAELDEELGTVSSKALAQARVVWRKR